MTFFEVFLPLACGFGVAFAAILAKRAMELGAGITRITVANCFAYLFVYFWIAIANSLEADWSYWYAPVIAGLIQFVGVIFFMLTCRSGHISIQTPIMGAKTVFVALFSALLLPYAIPMHWWVSSGLVFIAILLLGLPELLKKDIPKRAIFFALTSCVIFALADVYVERESQHFGRNAFLLTTFSVMALASLTLIPFFRQPFFAMPLRSWKWLAASSLCLALQLNGLLFAISYFGKATLINTVYASRGFWAIAIIWLIGPMLGNHERHVGTRTLIRRCIATGILTLAILNILFGC